MFEFILVKGDDVDFMFRMLVKVMGKVLSWNFNKYLILLDGKIIIYYFGLVKFFDYGFIDDVKVYVEN